MSNVNLFSEAWNRETSEMEAELGGVWIGSLKPLENSSFESEPDDEETLQREEETLRQKLAEQLTQMKEREADSREYLRRHGAVPNAVPDRVASYHTSR